MNRLDEIEARANTATEGPWEVNGPDQPWATISHGSDSILHAYEQHHPYCEGCECGDPRSEVALSDEDAEFIAHARTDMPALVAVARYALSQHAPDGHGNCGPCDDATGEDGWPCSTVREIHRLLGEEA